MQAGTSLAMKRSHTPDDEVLHTSTRTSTDASSAPKRVRANTSRPALADAYLDSLSKPDLLHLLRQIEQLLHDTPHEADLYALLYPDNLEERVSQFHLDQAAAAVAPTHNASAQHVAPPTASSTPMPAAPATPASVPSAVPRPYTPSIPAPQGATPPAPSHATPSALPAPPGDVPSVSRTSVGATTPAATAASGQAPTTTESTPDAAHASALSSSANISSRIAAILDSIHNNNSSGPMLNLQGQPLAPSKQTPGSTAPGQLSSLLNQSNLLSGARTPANSALTKLLEQNGASTFTRTPTAETHRYVPHMDVPRPTPGPFDYTRLGNTSSTGLGTSSNTPYGEDAHDGSGAQHRETARVTSTLPSYEDMIVEGLQAIGDVNGTPPRMLFHWMEDTYPLMKNFRPSASQALQKAFKRGRLHKVGSLYRINPDWDGSNTGRKPTRRPQVGKDHPMMVNGPKGPAPASPFKARAQYQGAAAYRQSTSPFSKQRSAHSRLLQSLRPGPKPYGQPGAAPLDNPASSIFQNGAAAAALLLAHQQRTRNPGSEGTSSDLTPSLTSLVQQLRASNQGADGTPGTGSSSLSSMLASALLKHVQHPGFATTPGVEPSPAMAAMPLAEQSGAGNVGNTFVSPPVLQSLSRLLGTRTEEPTPKPAESTEALPTTLPASGPGSLSASIETLMRQASRAAQATQEAHSELESAPGTSQADLDAAVSQTLEAAFQEIGPSDAPSRDAEGGEANELAGIDLSDYSDALRTLTAALTGSGADDDDDDENERHLADERAIAEAEADLSASHSPHDGEHDEQREHHAAHQEEESSESRMASLLKSYGVDVSGEAVRHLTETLRDPSVPIPAPDASAAHDAGPAASAAPEAPEAPVSGAELGATLPDDSLSDAAKNQAIQSQLEALIASLAQDGGAPSDGEE
ncbi:hypothetical protein MBRA1_002055 [Malassezia brasiliensis]|uniref:Histone H1 n=1 Tax=Malassezia brasiliensis TaxID=1821822 RepID=A0AAF0DU07_9BASI|nr:hypothetical protein MBRA1_002055 [Malassezia brasiliensis]